MVLLSSGSVILAKRCITNRVHCNIKKHPILFNKMTIKQTCGAKVVSQKGNSPDRKLKFLINTKIKVEFIK